MPSCPRDAVLRSLGSLLFASSGGRDIPPLLFSFSPLPPLPPPPPPPRSYVYSIISSAVGEEGRARSSEATYADRFPVSGSRECTSARSLRSLLFPLAYIAIRLCCEWQARDGVVSSRCHSACRKRRAGLRFRVAARLRVTLCLLRLLSARSVRAFSYRSPCITIMKKVQRRPRRRFAYLRVFAPGQRAERRFTVSLLHAREDSPRAFAPRTGC